MPVDPLAPVLLPEPLELLELDEPEDPEDDDFFVVTVGFVVVFVV